MGHPGGADQMCSRGEVGHHEGAFSDALNQPSSVNGRDGQPFEQGNGSLRLLCWPTCGAMNDPRAAPRTTGLAEGKSCLKSQGSIWASGGTESQPPRHERCPIPHRERSRHQRWDPTKPLIARLPVHGHGPKNIAIALSLRAESPRSNPRRRSGRSGHQMLCLARSKCQD